MSQEVARSTRAWIETIKSDKTESVWDVARSTRAWIETQGNREGTSKNSQRSHALRVRGLKLEQTRRVREERLVARSTRAWIETSSRVNFVFWIAGRTLYACVD